MHNKILNLIQKLRGFCLAVCLFVCPLLFLTNTTQNPFTVQPLLLSLFGGIFVLCYFGEAILRKEITFRYSKLDFVLIVFLLSAFISLIVNYFLTDNNAALINEFLRKSDYLILGLIFGFLFAKIASVKVNLEISSYKFLANIFFWCLTWFLWKVQASTFIAVLIFGVGVYLCFSHLKKYSIKEILDIMLAVCFCACLYGIMQALGFELFWTLDISKEFGARSVSTFGNPNFLASFILLFLPYSSLLFLQAKSKKENLISGFVTLVLALFLLISGTRSAWIGLIGSCLICVVLSKEFRKIFANKFIKVIVLFLIFCACAFCLVSGLKHDGISAPGARISEVKQAFDIKNLSLESKNLIQPLHQRLMMWSCALNNFKNSPILGKGLNSFQLNFPYCQGKLIARNPALDAMKMQANNAHNEYLEILSDGGFASFAIYIFFLISFFVMFNKNIKNSVKEEKYFYFVLVLGLIGVLIDNLLNITLRTLLVSFAFWFILSSVNNLNTKNKKVFLNRVVCFVIFLLTCFSVYVLINLQVRNFRAQTYELNGYKNLIKGNYQGVKENMEKAIKLSSLRPEPYYMLLNIYVELNDIPKAQNINEEVLKIYPAYYEINYRLATLKYAQNRYAEALTSLRETLALLPTYAPAAELFANVLLNQNYVSEEDKKSLENLTEILPYESNLPSYLAEIYFKENNCKDANIFALKALHKNVFDKSSSKILNTCQGASNADDFSKKINRINELKDKIKLSQDEKLFKDIKQLETEYPNDPEIAALFAEFYFRKGQFCKATDILKQAKNNNFWSKSYNYSLSLSAQKCGDSETSKQALEEILKFSPYDELAKNRLKNVNI